MSFAVPKVLVVEDHADTRAGLAMVLEGLGYRYALASGADEALLIAADTSFDVLLTDVYLPRLSGWRLVRQLKADGHLPAWVVSMSASGAALEAVQSRMAGCDVHLQKPFNLEELTEALSYPGSAEPNDRPVDPPHSKEGEG